MTAPERPNHAIPPLPASTSAGWAGIFSPLAAAQAAVAVGRPVAAAVAARLPFAAAGVPAGPPAAAERVVRLQPGEPVVAAEARPSWAEAPISGVGAPIPAAEEAGLASPRPGAATVAAQYG